jgi:hypothetical protein
MSVKPQKAFPAKILYPNFSHTYCHPWRKIKNNLLFIILFSSAVLTLHGLHRNKWEMGILEEIHVGAFVCHSHTPTHRHSTSKMFYGTYTTCVMCCCVLPPLSNPNAPIIMFRLIVRMTTIDSIREEEHQWTTQSVSHLICSPWENCLIRGNMHKKKAIKIFSSPFPQSFSVQYFQFWLVSRSRKNAQSLETLTTA